MAFYDVVLLSCPKEEGYPEDYEDAAGWDESAGRFALADGATDSSFARLWAEMLVSAMASDAHVHRIAHGDELGPWLRPLQEEWSRRVPWETLPFYAHQKAEAGAFAAFICLAIEPTADRGATFRWGCVAAGDCCLFHLRGTRLERAFPIEHSSQFYSTLPLLSSIPARNDGLELVRVAEGEATTGDQFILASDALARWFLDTCEHGGAPWEMLGAGPSGFAGTVARLRRTGGLHADDTTALVVTIRPEKG